MAETLTLFNPTGENIATSVLSGGAERTFTIKGGETVQVDSGKVTTDMQDKINDGTLLELVGAGASNIFLLGVVRGADLEQTGDQAIIPVPGPASRQFVLTKAVVRAKTGTPPTDADVNLGTNPASDNLAATQTLTDLDAGGESRELTLIQPQPAISGGDSIKLDVGVAAGGAQTADVFIFGFWSD